MFDSLQLLPLPPVLLDASVSALVTAGEINGVTKEEATLSLDRALEDWLLKPQGGPRDFPNCLKNLFTDVEWRHPAEPAWKTYATLLPNIVRSYDRTRHEAACILSELPQITSLVHSLGASPAAIAEILSRNGKADTSWWIVKDIMAKLALSCELQPIPTNQLLDEDLAGSEVDFADADMDAVVEIIATVSERAGLGTDFTKAVAETFGVTGGAAFPPYLQTLLFACITTHFYEHPPGFIYTFSPRGAVANALFARFPPALAATGNPVLNNFKAVDRISRSWAESRTDNHAKAKAFVTVVEGLSSLARLPRIKMSGLLRRAVFRWIQISTPPDIILGECRNAETIRRFFRKVSEAPTHTRGVIEQRLTDFIARISFPDDEWIFRGLGDPVNAANRASRKLGDCDTQDVTSGKCVAFEAHAGKLTDVYVAEHLRTLRINLPSRLEEWSRVSNREKWELVVKFHVHDDSTKNIQIPTHGGIEVTLEITTYKQEYERLFPCLAGKQTEVAQLFNHLVIRPLNLPFVPMETKRIARELLA